MNSDKIHLELTEVQYDQLMNALGFARTYLKGCVEHEQKVLGDAYKLNAMIYEDTLKLFRDIQDQAVNSSRRKEID